MIPTMIAADDGRRVIIIMVVMVMVYIEMMIQVLSLKPTATARLTNILDYYFTFSHKISNALSLNNSKFIYFKHKFGPCYFLAIYL